MKLTLSLRQAEIYAARKSGERNNAIARRLNLKNQTVCEHYTRARKKIEEAAWIAQENDKRTSK